MNRNNNTYYYQIILENIEDSTSLAIKSTEYYHQHYNQQYPLEPKTVSHHQ